MGSGLVGVVHTSNIILNGPEECCERWKLHFAFQPDQNLVPIFLSVLGLKLSLIYKTYG